LGRLDFTSSWYEVLSESKCIESLEIISVGVENEDWGLTYLCGHVYKVLAIFVDNIILCLGPNVDPFSWREVDITLFNTMLEYRGN